MKFLKRSISIVMTLIMSIIGICVNIPMDVKADIEQVTIYFVDATSEGWIENNSAVIELVDNTNGHDSYTMSTTDNKVWSVKVPVSAYNITFNRYSNDKTTLWNSWSAGGRDGKVTYKAEGNSNGLWTEEKYNTDGFEVGDTVYLDVTGFTDWLKDSAVFYINFNEASKEQNDEANINIESADKSVYNPIKITNEIKTNIYKYTITEEDEGATSLRFWRGNANTLWNCSVVLSYEDYVKGENCIQVTGWSDNGNLVKRESSDEENNEDFENWEDMQDTDRDQLPDFYEEDIGTDIANPDTDGDGLTDGFEILYVSSDPLKVSSSDNGISDAALDVDEDELTMLEEYEYGTDPLDSDIDCDGLKDGEELDIYSTDPLKNDTDEDGITDGDEIFIGLNPLDTETFGYSDSEYKSVQKIDSDNSILDDVNKENEDYQLGLEIEAKGSVFTDIIVRESAYSNSIKNGSILGIMPEIIFENEEKIENIELTFKIDLKNIYEEYSTKDLEGIKRYNIFWFDESENLLVPLYTSIDVENNTISTSMNKVGTYCIIDMEKWLSDLGCNLVEKENVQVTNTDKIQAVQLTNMDEIQVDTVSSNTIVELEENEEALTEPNLQEDLVSNISMMAELSTESTVTEKKDKIDIVFNINNNLEGLTDLEFANIKSNIEIIGKSLFYETKDVRIYVLDQHGNAIRTSFGQYYSSNITQLSTMIEQLLNTEPETPYIDEQVNTMLNTINLRNDAFKVAVFLGNSFMTDDTDSLIEKIKSANIHCCVIEPNTKPSSWYDILATSTSGILVYSYTDFSDDILNYIYGYEPNVPTSKYNMIASNGLKLILLNAELNANSTTDTDVDTLTDWKEVNQDRVIVNSDGTVQLYTYKEYVEKYEPLSTVHYAWAVRYEGTVNSEGKSLEQIMSGIYVLPVLSDPTQKDGDNDGILDADEFVWDGIDERYKNVGPLHEDTMEIFFPEISKSTNSNRNKLTYITINGNNVVLHAKVVIKGNTGNLASSSLKTTGLTTEQQAEVSNIEARLGQNVTLKDLVIDGITNRWNGIYSGSEYDFYKGLEVNFSVDISENLTPELYEKKLEITIKDGICGVSNKTGEEWNTNANRYVTLYSSECNIESHKNKDKTKNKCTKYDSTLYNLAVYEGIIAHEMGHVFGLKDMYYSAECNDGYQPISNVEIPYDKAYFGLPQGKGIMKADGCAYPNDIEMVLLAFSENTPQYFVPKGKSQKISKAIKHDIEYKNENTGSTIYIWNPTKCEFEVK